MKVNITDIDQRFSLDTGRVTSFVVLRLPSGYVVRAAVEDESLQHIIQESQNPQSVAQNLPNQIPLDRDGYFTELNPLTQPTRVPPPEEEVYPHHVASGEVEWEKLPDTQLPPSIKHIMRESKLPPTMTIAELDQLKLAISTELANRPIVGQVNFNQGAQRPNGGVPRRTVPMDAAGNPIPPGGIVDPDPGEAPEDEDGVPQA